MNFDDMSFISLAFGIFLFLLVVACWLLLMADSVNRAKIEARNNSNLASDIQALNSYLETTEARTEEMLLVEIIKQQEKQYEQET